MSLHFLHIGYLAWIIPAIGGLWFAWRKRGTSPAGRHYVLALISLGYVLGIIAALAEPYIGTVQNKTCVFVTDISASVPDSELTRISQRIRELAASAQTGLDMHLVCFASHPVRIPEFPFPGMSWDLAELRRSKKDIFESLPDNYYRQTDIQAALLYAQMLIKNNGVVHLFTDGLETRGAVEQAVQAGLRQNIQYHYEVLNSPQTDELVLSKVVVPQQVRQGQNRSMQVLLESSRDADVEVVVNNLNTNATQRYPFTVQPGLNELSVPVDTSEASIVRYEVAIESAADTGKDNNQQRVSVSVLRKPVVAVWDKSTTDKAYQAIQNWLSETAEVQIWSEQMDLSTIDALFIADADQDILTGRHIDRIRQAVDAGMGLMVFPGPQLVADRLLAEGPLAELLPVSLYQDGKKTNPDTTVVFIVDTSGSMTGSRIAVAREIARRAISRLAPYDKAGIVEFYGNRRWAAPIQSAANQLDLYRALNRLTAGGGTVIIPAMEEAYYALLNVNSTTRHIVVISDGGVENANYEALLRKIADSRISVSTILVGPATHTGFMAELSQWGQGGFFHAEERFILPDMNFKTVLDKTGSPYRHTTEPLAARYPSTVLSGISIDKLVGSWDYLPAQIKKGGQAVVEFSSGQPMISLWNYSLGQVAFWSVDLFHQQTADTDISRMVANAARKIYRTQNQDIAVQVRQNNNRFDVQVQNNNRIPSDSAVPQTLVLYSDENEKLRLPLSFRDGRTAHISIHDLPEGFYHIDIEKSPDQIIAQSGFSANPVPEIKAYQSDHQLIDRLSGLSGRHAVSQSAEAPAGTLELWPYCIGFSMILFLLHILIRRLPLSLRKSLAVWVGFLLISSSATFAAVETENTNISSVNPSPRNIYVRMDPNSHRPLFPDMVSMLGSESANLKTVAVLCGDFASARTLGASSQIPDFSDGMLTGFYLYKLTEYAQAYDAFQQASQLAKTDNDRKYALAWALRMAEKSDKRDRFETRLLASEPFLKHHCRILELLYGLNSDLNGLKRLYEKIESLPAFNEADKVRLEQQIIDMSVDRSNDQTAVSLQSGQKGKTNVAFMLGQVRACLIQGDRIQAAQMLEAMLSNPELSENWLFIAQNAAGMAFYDIADTAADRVMKQVDSQRYAAGIFRVTLMLSRGNQAGAIEMLDTLQKTVKLNERQDYEIAQYYEKLGQYTRAIEQYRQIYLRTQAVDVQMRVAWLHEKNGNFEQAYQAWLTLWKDCRQPALLYQIQPRLLEVASRTGQLASLAIELEESLEKNGPDTRILELLVDLYVSVGDSIAAVELVRQYCGDMDVKSLEWQYRIYLRCREYGRCRRVLFRLIEKDPLHSGDYYRQLALLAVEKGDEKDALSVVKSIQSSRQVNTIDLEYTAGIWDLLERPELAMEAYGQLLRQESPAAETWLLWSNAAAKAGRKEEAISTLSTLLADEVSDDLFTVAVDALLNLKADATRLENALVHIYARIAQAPDKVFFYRLAVDVLSEIAGGGDYAEFLFPAAIYAPDGRVALLQEIQRAAASKQTDELLDYGIVLVYMDTQLPPHAGIELGKSFLERGEYKTAHFLFHRTPYLFEDSGLCLGIADAYDRIGAFNEAELLVREALAVAPDNPQLLIRSASYHEIKGNYEDAWQEYFRLYQLTLNSLSAPHENSGNGQKTPVKNTQAEDRYFQIALHGLLSTMAADKQAADTLHYFETSLDTLKQQDLKSDPIAYARLVRLWKDYEQICLAREDMTRLNKHVEPLVQKVLDKPELLTEMIQNRLAGGDIKSAFDIAGKIDKKLWPRQLQWLSPDSLDTSDLSALTDEVVYQALMKAILSNNDEQAQRWMEEILSRKPGLPDDQLQSVELTSALLLGKSELLRRVISKQVTALSAAPSAKRYIAANRLIDAVWPILSETDRKGLLSQIAAANAADADIQHLVDMTLIRSHYKSYYPPERAYRYAEDGEKQVVRLAEILSYSEPNQRTGIVQRAVTSLPAARRCMFLLELVGQIRYSISDQEQSEYIALFKASLPLKLAAQSQYTTLSRYTGKNRSSCLLVQSFAEILLSQMPDNIAVNAFAVKSRFNAGQMREAKALARNVIDTLTEAVDINYEFKAILTDAVRALSHEDISEVLSDYMLTLDITGPSLPLYFITAVLNETLGDHQQARTQISLCFRRMPDNMTVLRQMADWYEAAGLKKELTDILSAHAQNSGTSAIFLWRTLVRLYYQTSQTEQMKIAAAKDMTILHNQNYLALYHDASDVPGIVTYFRKTQTDFRNEGRFLSLVWPDWDSSEGLLGWDEEKNRLSRRKDTHQVLCMQPALRDDYHRLWQAMTPDRNDFSKVADAYAHILFTEGQSEQEIKRIMDNKRPYLSRKEFELLLNLVKYTTQAGVFKNPDVLDRLKNQAEIPDVDSLKIFADAYRAIGQSSTSQRYYQWIWTYQMVTQPQSNLVFDTINTWLDKNDTKDANTLEIIKPWIHPESFNENEPLYESAKTRFIAKWYDDQTYKARMESIEKIIVNYEYDVTYNSLRTDMLYYDMRMDRPETFARNLDDILRTQGQSVTGDATVDYNSILSMNLPMDLVDRYCRLIQTRLNELNSLNLLSRDDVIRNLAVLSVALYRSQYPTHAQAVLAQIYPLNGQPTLVSLWISDALRQCGRIEQANDIEQELVRKGAMPKIRLKITSDNQ